MIRFARKSIARRASLLCVSRAIGIIWFGSWTAQNPFLLPFSPYTEWNRRDCPLIDCLSIISHRIVLLASESYLSILIHHVSPSHLLDLNLRAQEILGCRFPVFDCDGGFRPTAAVATAESIFGITTPPMCATDREINRNTPNRSIDSCSSKRTEGITLSFPAWRVFR